jgi:hypothetical protein
MPVITGLRTIFLDAGGVLVFPNWNRISAALKERGVSGRSSRTRRSRTSREAGARSDADNPGDE